MRKYIGNTLVEVICNCCGNHLIVENEIVREGVTTVYAEWGYFSDKDGENHAFDMCEPCYDKMVAGFRHPVSVVSRTELI